MMPKPKIYRARNPLAQDYPWRARLDGLSWPCRTWQEALEKTAMHVHAKGARAARGERRVGDGHGVIYMPEPERKPQRPIVSADTYPLGTRWMSEDSSVWEVEWDTQDKRHMWVLVADRQVGSES